MMADQPPITNPLVQVTMRDGAVWQAQTYNPDMLRYERTASKHQWAGPTREPFRFLTFLAWSAGRREGHIPTTLTWEQFSEDECMSVEAPNSTPVPPTPPGVDPGSS